MPPAPVRKIEAAPAAAAPVAAPAKQPDIPLVAGRAVGYRRDGTPIQRVAAETGVDQFHIPAHLPPPGWSWEWKEHTVVGEIRHGVQAFQAQVGWEPVMCESYPGVFAPVDVKGPVIRGGLMLKERPAVLTQEAKMDELNKARQKVGQATRQYSRLNTDGATTAEFDQTAQRSSYIRQNQERVDIPQGAVMQPPID
jgi:hypothetical protein